MLDKLLTSHSRSEILRLLFDGQKHEFYMRELEKLVGTAISSIQKEVKHLSELDLIKSRKDGNRLYYYANIEHPIYPELVSIVEKTVGITALLKEALAIPQIECAFIFGSIAKNKERGSSDIDLVVVGQIGMRALSKTLAPIQEKVGREINPHIYTEQEFKKRIKEKEHFISAVLKGTIKPLIGNVNDYRSTN